MNKFISVSYRLFILNDASNIESPSPSGEGRGGVAMELFEETAEGRPFTFISGFGVALDAFEKNLIDLEKGADFDFRIEPDNAFGPYYPEGVQEYIREMFCIDGKFDAERVKEGEILQMRDADGNPAFARVLKVTDKSVTLDCNHPLAGCTLNYVGKVLENREATNEEITQFANILSGHGCGGCHGGCHGEGGCNGNCNGGDCHKGDCGGECHKGNCE